MPKQVRKTNLFVYQFQKRVRKLNLTFRLRFRCKGYAELYFRTPMLKTPEIPKTPPPPSPFTSKRYDFEKLSKYQNISTKIEISHTKFKFNEFLYYLKPPALYEKNSQHRSASDLPPPPPISVSKKLKCIPLRVASPKGGSPMCSPGRILAG